MFSIFEALNVSCKLTVHFKEMLNFNFMEGFGMVYLN